MFLFAYTHSQGGHTNFYHDSVSGKTINVGVQAWMEYKDSFDFPARMNVSTSGSMQFTANTAQYIDTKTGKPVPNYAMPSSDDLYPALARYLEVLEKYEDMILPGLLNFPKPEDIPEDLLMPFGEFVTKYNLEAAVPQIWDSTAQGLGDTMSVVTLAVMQASGVPMVKALLGQGAAAVPASGRLYDLYDAVANFLGDDVLYSSTVVGATRKSSGIYLRVQGADGKVTCIQAKRLLISAEPTPETMAAFSPDSTESSVLGKFKFPTVYAGIIQHPSLQVLNSYSDRTADAGSYNYTSFPIAPQVGRIDYLGGTENLFQFTAVGTTSDTTESMQALIGEAIDNMIATGVLPATEGGKVTFDSFANHGHMHAHVSAEDLRAGFVQDLNALQGRSNTWYTGAAFSAGFTTVVWEYNKVLLPELIKGL